MKIVVLIGVCFLGSCFSLLQAGSVFLLGTGNEADGALTLTATGIHVDGSAASDINLGDILEADFGETPFQVNYFSSAENPRQFPPDWKGADIGHPTLPGSNSYTDGTLTLAGSGVDLQRKENEDQYYVFGRPWTGDGQLTGRLKEVDASAAPNLSRTQVGPMLRQNLDPLSMISGMGVGKQGGGLFLSRYSSTNHAGWTGFSSDPPPIWVRLVRSADSIDFLTSGDGLKWEIIRQSNLKLPPDAWLGFYQTTFSDKASGKSLLDQVTIAPGPAEPETVPPGVLLRSGSFLAGTYHAFDGKTGRVDRNGKSTSLTLDQVAAVVMHPVTLRQIADVAGQTGLLMKNGDFLAADIQRIDGDYIIVNSLQLGILSYYGESGRAAVLQAVQSQPSDYEVRLKDGSILRAKTLATGSNQLDIGEVSGMAISVPADEVAQVRAGLTHVQPLISLPWKANTPPAPAVTKTPPPAAAASGATAAPQAVPAPAPAPTVTPDTGVQCWNGPNREQILAATAGTSMEFPLSGKFRALALRVAVASNAAPNAQAVVRIVADGREIARTPPFKAGDQPRFLEVTLQSPKTLTITADSIVAGTKVLFIDPVAIREE